MYLKSKNGFFKKANNPETKEAKMAGWFFFYPQNENDSIVMIVQYIWLFWIGTGIEKKGVNWVMLVTRNIQTQYKKWTQNDFRDLELVAK